MANNYADDLRLGDLVVQGNHGEVCLIGFPYDEGVRRNNGRIGSANGPAFFRKYLKRMGALVNAEYSTDLRNLAVTDAGDVCAGKTLEQAHELLSLEVERVIRNGGIPFCIGGGNDQSYANVRGLLQGYQECLQNRSFTVINIDAHLDVRPRLKPSMLAHSGSPFRILLEEDLLWKINKENKYIAFACQGAQCSQEHVDFLAGYRHEIHWLSSLRNISTTVTQCFLDILRKEESVFVSFDLDSIKGADAPGVSCSSPIGLTAEEALQICYMAGTQKNVVLFDVSEYNPDVEEYRSGRLVAMMFYYFLMGYSQRGVK